MNTPDTVGGQPTALRQKCGHDSRSVFGCLNCEAADAIEELCRAAPAGGDVECFVREMRTSKGSEFFVVVKRDGRELTPHMYTERWKAEYEVASWQHLLCDAPEPDLLAYGPSEDSATAGSGEVEDVASELERMADDDCRGNDDEPLPAMQATLRTAAALLRKLQQGGGIVISYEYLEKMFFRLREAREIKAAIDRTQVTRTPQLLMAENWICAIEYSIRDYIKAHSASQDQDGGKHG